jgi:signal transduction histidine kinase
MTVKAATEEVRDSSRSVPTRPPRSEFLERVAHELRGPAGVTLGALEELELALEGADTPQTAPLFAMARRGVKRILRTADRLARTAQLESGRHAMSHTATDLRLLITQVAEEVEELEARRSVKLERILPQAACTVMVDAPWLQVALGELLAQALRSARKQASIELSRDAGVVRIVISDDGSVLRNEEPVAGGSTGHLRRDGGFPHTLASEVVRAHGGDLQWQVLSPQGLSAIVVL